MYPSQITGAPLVPGRCVYKIRTDRNVRVVKRIGELSFFDCTFPDAWVSQNIRCAAGRRLCFRRVVGAHVSLRFSRGGGRPSHRQRTMA